jgi:hypothetical protein
VIDDLVEYGLEEVLRLAVLALGRGVRVLLELVGATRDTFDSLVVNGTGVASHPDGVVPLVVSEQFAESLSAETLWLEVVETDALVVVVALLDTHARGHCLRGLEQTADVDVVVDGLAAQLLVGPFAYCNGGHIEACEQRQHYSGKIGTQ